MDFNGYKDKLEAVSKEIEAEMTKLEAKLKSVEGTAKNEIAENLRTLDSVLNKAKQKIALLEAQTEAEWENIKDDTITAYEDIKESLNAIMKK